MYNIQVNDRDTASYPVIDMHSHDYARSGEDIDKRVRIMDEKGIE